MRKRLVSREGDGKLPLILCVPEGERGPYRTPLTRGGTLADPGRERIGVLGTDGLRIGADVSAGENELSEGEDRTACKSDSSPPETGCSVTAGVDD